MSSIELPLLRESTAFARRLVDAARSFAMPRYHFHRRVNWSYRFSEAFYTREAELFRGGPEAYLQGSNAQPPVLEDVYALQLRSKQVMTVAAKVAAHTLFAWLGRLADAGLRRDGIEVYRKAYVDDIELVFAPCQQSVVRAVYPFPINLRRQWRYLRFLRQQGHRFKLAGNPYLMGDIWRFLWQRNVRSLMRLESRAQVRHALEVAALGVQLVQLSDEFDIGSLDFARTLGRLRLAAVNSAHGVGKYLPVHAYQAFHILTQRQREYYLATRPCAYQIRQLNDRAGPARVPVRGGGCDVVFLSQSFGRPGGLIEENEATLVRRMHHDLSAVAGMRMHYKPHPNHPAPVAPAGFALLADLGSINDQPGTLFLSFFSTCQIDPAFKGRKLLVRGHLIHPEISFDEGEEIVDADELITILRDLPFKHPDPKAART